MLWNSPPFLAVAGVLGGGHAELRDVLAARQRAHLRIARQAAGQEDLVHGPSLLHRSTDGTRADPACGGHGATALGTAMSERTGRSPWLNCRPTRAIPTLAARIAPRTGRPAVVRVRRYEGPRAVPARHRPSTTRIGTSVHCPSRGRERILRYAETRRTGGYSGRRPRTFERTSIPTAVGRGRSRSRVTNRATMSDRPRARNASGGTYRLIVIDEKTIASRDSREAIVVFRMRERNGGRPPPSP